MIYFASVFIGTRLAAFLDRRISCRAGALLGVITSSVALGLMAFVLEQRSITQILVLLGLTGLGLGIFIPFNGSMVLAAFGKNATGYGGGLIATLRSLGIALGVALALQLQPLLHSFSKPFFVGAGLSFIALVLLLCKDQIPGCTSNAGTRAL